LRTSCVYIHVNNLKLILSTSCKPYFFAPFQNHCFFSTHLFQHCVSTHIPMILNYSFWSWYLNIYLFLFNYWILFWIFACVEVLSYDIGLLKSHVKIGWHMYNKHIWVFIFYFFQNFLILFQELCDNYFFNPI
jgi:hypothetical protein